jgi:hypothetical protein
MIEKTGGGTNSTAGLTFGDILFIIITNGFRNLGMEGLDLLVGRDKSFPN